MALIKCFDCGRIYSDHVSACITCGCPTKISIDKSFVEEKFISQESVLDQDESIKAKGFTLGDKWLYTFGLWFGWAIFASFVFGDGPIGTIIQGVVQIGGTIYVWKQPTIK